MSHFTPRPYQLRALLDGAVSTLVVPLKPQPEGNDVVVDLGNGTFAHTAQDGTHMTGEWRLPLPIGKPVWIREAWFNDPDEYDYTLSITHPFYKGAGVIYRADQKDPRAAPIGGWLSPATMPRRFSRLTIVPTEARVCRVQELHLHEMYEQGIPRPGGPILGSVVTETQNARNRLYNQWTADHGPDAWERNPWVQIARVEVHHCNIDRMAKEDAA